MADQARSGEEQEAVEGAETKPASDSGEPAAQASGRASAGEGSRATTGGSGERPPRGERRRRARSESAQEKERSPLVRLPKPEKVRGKRQERRGVVVSAAMDKTIVVRVDTLKAHPRYKKIIRRSTKLHAHDERNEAKVGDVVRVVETRPLSRTKRWRLVEIIEVAK